MNWLVVHSDDSGAYEPVLLVEGMPEGLHPNHIRKRLEQAGFTNLPWAGLYLTAESHWQQPIPADIPRVYWPSLPVQRIRTTVRLTPEDLALITRAARQESLSTNEWMLGRLLRAAKDVLGIPWR